MSEATVAERYARAIFELSVETGQDLVRPIQAFADVYKSSRELQGVLDNPLVERSKRDAVLEEVAARVGLRGPALNAIRLLAERHKLRALPEIARRLSRLSDRHAGVVRATVTSAVRLPDFFYQRIEQELSNAVGRRILLERREDPSLIGGIVTRIGDNIIDGSIRGRLAEVERRLLAQSA
ncbi:MAG TPA: ATP synthase F1 subunit delta [Polyangiaceae bacterium]|nr:ATP synthase F1 subunit delta [Polyangiaceae bacterium]